MSFLSIPRIAAAVVLLGLLAVPFVMADDPFGTAERSLGLARDQAPFGDVAEEAAGVVRTATGVIVPIVRIEGDTTIGLSPCGNEVPVSGETIPAAHFVIDAGHGGSEPGAVGPNGLAERDVNMDVAARVRQILEAEGATVVLTRESDLRVTVAARAEIAKALSPIAFVSIHHNAVPLGSGPGIGSELYHQEDDAESKRLAGIMYEEYVERLQPFLDDWAHGDQPGALARRSARTGLDFYGILRGSAGTPAVLSEAAFLSDPEEAALLATPEFRQAEAEAIAAALIRFASTDSDGSGFVDTKVSSAPAGGGGGAAGCEDPPLG